MTLISKHHNMIKVYYSSESSIGKQVIGYVDASFKDILTLDVTKTKVTGTQWKELASNLQLQIGELVDQQHPSFTKHYNKDTKLSEHDWIKVLNANPEILHYPIVIRGHDYFLIKNPSDIFKFLEPNSQGIDEKKHQ